MASQGAAPEDDGLAALFEGSPDLEVHTSAAAETSFLLGIIAFVSAPFSLTHALSLGTGLVAAILALVGMATTSRQNVAGQALVPLGLFLASIALMVVGLRYAGLDTAFGDELAPTVQDWLERLNSLLPRP